MERLTKYICDHAHGAEGVRDDALTGSYCRGKFEATAIVDRLAAYEDTGLEPEDIKRAFNEAAVLKLAGQALGITPDRLRELAQADRLLEKKVYEPNKRGIVSTYEVISVHISYCSVLVGWNLIDGIYSNLNGFEISALGKSVFLTRAEAETALRREQE